MKHTQGTYGILGNRLQLTGPTVGEDALWLAASLPTLPPVTRVLDAFCGIGTAALALLARQPHLAVTAVDIDPALTALAHANAAANALPLTVHTSDILTYANTPFPHVLCNPPYHAQAQGHATADAFRRRSKSLPQDALTAWLKALHALTEESGHIHLILHSHCAEALTAFARTHTCRLTLRPLRTAEAKPPKRLLATLRKSTAFALTQADVIPAHQPALRTRILHNAEALS